VLATTGWKRSTDCVLCKGTDRLGGVWGEEGKITIVYFERIRIAQLCLRELDFVTPLLADIAEKVSSSNARSLA
jgi:hypothetical protein